MEPFREGRSKALRVRLLRPWGDPKRGESVFSSSVSDFPWASIPPLSVRQPHSPREEGGGAGRKRKRATYWPLRVARKVSHSLQTNRIEWYNRPDGQTSSHAWRQEPKSDESDS